MSVGYGADPGFLAVSPQVTIVRPTLLNFTTCLTDIRSHKQHVVTGGATQTHILSPDLCHVYT